MGHEGMARLTFIEPDGTRREVDARDDQSAMDGAVRAGIVGIEAECGGSMSCGTCHVYVESDSDLGGPSEDERAVLDVVAAERRPSSRLSCQIEMRPSLAGLVLRVPAFQQ
jgi:ferredoxin, 2Fe-2S